MQEKYIHRGYSRPGSKSKKLHTGYLENEEGGILERDWRKRQSMYGTKWTKSEDGNYRSHGEL
jgi:hypothetical protein